MRISNKIFPYPILCNDINLSNYPNKVFDFKLSLNIQDDIKKDNNINIRELSVDTNSDYIIELYKENKIKVVLVLECTKSLYRKIFTVPLNEVTQLSIPKTDLCGKVEINAFAIANCDLNLKCDEFEDDYLGIDFKLSKDDIIAMNSGYVFNVDAELYEDTVKDSIFSIIMQDGLQNGNIKFHFNEKKIVISLSKENYATYSQLNGATNTDKIFLSNICIPALFAGLVKCKELCEEISGDDSEEINDTYRWFKPLNMAYKRKNDKDLTKEFIKNCEVEDLYEISNDLFNYAFNDALEQIKNNLASIQEEDE